MAPVPQNESLIRALHARVALASVRNDIHKRAAYSRAIEKVEAHRIGITTAVDIGTIKGIGVRIQKLLEKILNGEEADVPPGAQDALEQGHAIPQGFAYIPKPGTGARAILVALFREGKRPGYPGFLTKDQIQAAATATGLSNTSMYAQPNLGNYYSAWSGIETLIENGLVTRRKNGIGNHQHFTLTDLGRQLAFFLEEQMGQQGAGPVDRDIRPVLPHSFSPGRSYGGCGRAVGYQPGPGGFPEVMLGRGRDIERGTDLSQVEELEEAASEQFRVYRAVCKSSTSVRKKYTVQLHAQVSNEAGGMRVSADKEKELVARIKEMGFLGNFRILEALRQTGYDQALAVQRLIDRAGGAAGEDREEEELSVLRSECTCPEGKSSGGRCKHAAALFLRVEDHLKNGAELDRSEPGKKKAAKRKEVVGEDGLPPKGAPKRRKKDSTVGMAVGPGEDRSLAAIAAQLARSAGASAETPSPKPRNGPRTSLGVSPQQMAAQAALERAAIQASLQESVLAERREARGARSVGTEDEDVIEVGQSAKGRIAGNGTSRRSLVPAVGVPSKGKGKVVEFVDLDSDDDRPGRQTAESDEDAALLSSDWRSPSLGSGRGGPGQPADRQAGRQRGGDQRDGAGQGCVRSMSWDSDDAEVDLVELERLVNKVSETAERTAGEGLLSSGSGHRGLKRTQAIPGTGRVNGATGGEVKEVTVIVDKTERQTNRNPNSVYLELHRQHAALKAVAGVGLSAEKRKLEIGDYLWLATADDGSFVLDTVIERKTMSDLVTRSATNAHLKQLRQMRASGLPHVCLLLEGAFRNARNFVPVVGQASRGDVDSAEAVWQLMAELLMGTAEGVDVPAGLPPGRSSGPPPMVRVLQTKDVKGTCKLLTHISAAMAARLGEGGTVVEEGVGEICLENFNKEARKRRTQINKLVKETHEVRPEAAPREAAHSGAQPSSGVSSRETVMDSGAGPSGARAGWRVEGTAGRLCEECEERGAAVACAECEQALCTDCSASLHSRGARRGHPVVALTAQRRCDECEGAVATVSCGDCEQALCSGCSQSIHSKGARVRHVVTALSPPVGSAAQPHPPASLTSSDVAASVSGASGSAAVRESGAGMGPFRGNVHIHASSKVYARLCNVELGPGVLLEPLSGGAFEEGPVQGSLFLSRASREGGMGQTGFWVQLVKGDDFLRGMVEAQAAVTEATTGPIPECDLQTAVTLFLSSLPPPPTATSASPVRILVLENVLNNCRSMAAKAEQERINGGAGGSDDGNCRVRNFLAFHDLGEEMWKWIVRAMFSHKWHVQLTSNDVESMLLFKHLAKAYGKKNWALA